LAQGDYLGTKSGGGTPILSTGSAPGAAAFLQMLAALIIVLVLLKFVAPKLLGRAGKRLVTTPSGHLQVEETAHFAGGALYIVRARSKTLLLGANATSISFLADLTESAAAVADPPTFQEIVEVANQAPINEAAFQPEVAVAAVPTGAPTETDVELVLRRLERLAG